MSAPLISVVLPCFNYEQYVGAAIESALAQDWPCTEIIAVDDGSTDASAAVLAGFGDSIRVIGRENGGLNAATDTGVAAARGELITFLDADDAWPPGRLRVLADALIARPEAGLSYGDMAVVDERGEAVHASFNAHKGHVPAPSGRFLGRMLSFNCVSAGSLMVRASLRESFHPIPAHAAWNDWWIATQVLREAEIVAVPEIVNIYRQHGANMNLGADERGAIELLRAELEFRRWLLANTAPPLVTVAELTRGLGTLDWAIGRIAGFDGISPELVAQADELSAEEFFRAGQEALRVGRTEDGLCLLVGSAAHAPAWSAPRALLAQALGVLAEGPDRRPPTRSKVELVLVERVLSTPSLLTQWAGRSAGEDATLVIGGVSDVACQDELVALVARLGLDREESVDLLSVCERDPATVAVRLGRPVDGVLV
ncbi:MAG TPA: glycosyltransferase [Solirubrobacteraceae bacterium]|jgi:hypothetical protein|nr:glycosyltransferase [Solirubrobacteraceae bacterium]